MWGTRHPVKVGFKYGWVDMADTLSVARRSEIMSNVKGKNTMPEKQVRSIIHELGCRFALFREDLPGKPDIVLPRHHKVVFVNGCFWHGHKNCSKGKLPKSNLEFWEQKITMNKRRDRRVIRDLKKLGWYTLTVWQCELKDKTRLTRKLRAFLDCGHASSAKRI